MAIIPESYMNSVVSIGIPINTGIAWIGTGFFVCCSSNQENQVYPYLVSNKHVFEGRDNVVIRMKKKGRKDLQIVNVRLKSDDDRILYVPHEIADIDIAVLLLNAQVIKDEDFDFPCFHIEQNAMSSAELRSHGFDEGSIIYMLGFPMGLVNEASNLPICRMGCVSRMSETQITEQHNILVDIQNFPGNSGSPIITRPEIVSIEGTPSLTKSVLFGIVHSYIPYNENLINSQTNEVVEVRSENSGIALVHPVEYIRDIIKKIQDGINVIKDVC